MVTNPYPITVIQTRYSGVYEGGKWAAFHCDHDEIPGPATGSDVPCGAWWNANGHLVGVGSDPDEAIGDLRLKIFNDPEKGKGFSNFYPQLPHDGDEWPFWRRDEISGEWVEKTYEEVSSHIRELYELGYRIINLPDWLEVPPEAKARHDANRPKIDAEIEIRKDPIFRANVREAAKRFVFLWSRDSDVTLDVDEVNAYFANIWV